MSDAMLECVVCGSRKWRQLEFSKANELATSGAVLLACEGCRHETYWKTSDYGRRGGTERRAPTEAIHPEAVDRILRGERAGVQAPPDRDMYRKAAAGIVLADRRTGADRRQSFQRGHDRVPLRLPIRVRVNSRGAYFEEQNTTLNVSRHGVYFRSRLPYEKGLLAYLILNYSSQNPTANIEQPATVMRVEPPGGDGTRGIGVLIDKQASAQKGQAVM
ncbi:MAG: PilZ domain-containing protein [Acidobacteria bacterium]|nr:PilZ domain-containing protein [Acidobacteriota bacterium]